MKFILIPLFTYLTRESALIAPRYVLFIYCYILTLFPISAKSLPRPDAETKLATAFDLAVDFSYFKTLGVYDGTGQKIDLDNFGSSYDQSQIDLKFNYGMADTLNLGLESRFRQTNSFLLETQVSNSGLESIGGDIKYRLAGSAPLLISFYAGGRIGLYENETIFDPIDYTKGLVLGDAGNEFLFGLIGSYLFRSQGNFRKSGTVFNLSLFYAIPPNSLSSELRVDPNVVVNIGKKAQTRIGLLSTLSLQDDPYTSSPESKPWQMTGASLLYNSINRQIFKPYFNFFYALSGFNGHLGFKVGYVVNGQYTDQGIDLGLQFIWSPKPTKSPDRKIISRFKQYQIEAYIIKVSPRGLFIKIDKGLAHDVIKGMIFDIYKSDHLNKNVLIARGKVYDVQNSSAIVRIFKTFTGEKIGSGDLARGHELQ